MRDWARRGAIAAALTLAGLTALTPEVAAGGRRPAAAAAIDLSTPQGALTAQRKIQCSTIESRPEIFWWEGQAFSRRQGERDRLLFTVEGMNIRACTAIEDPVRGRGFRLVSREILLYKDPVTGVPLSTWANPWTGETVKVLHIANDPVNNSFFEKDREGKPSAFRPRERAGEWYQSTTVPLFYRNPLTAGYEAEVGGTYHATEMFHFLGDLGDLTDPTRDSATVKIAWVRMSDWLPWMKMNGREGLIYFSTAGVKLDDFSQLSDTLKAEIAARYPDYATPPPADDQRPNVTSWSYYRDISEGRIAPPPRD